MPKLSRYELELARREDPERFEREVERYHQRALDQAFSTPLVYAAFQRRSNDSYFRIAAWAEVERRLGGKPAALEGDADDTSTNIIVDMKRLSRWVKARLIS